jgi:hypothetical protein
LKLPRQKLQLRTEAGFRTHSADTRGDTAAALRCELSIKPEEDKMKTLVVMTALPLTCGSVYADSCKVEAGSKKLAGAAMTSFMKKCETDATAACDKSAAEKKLSGAAKTSFTKKCVSDAVGN